MKYKIMLIDDEEEVRQSIIKKISWGELGFEIVADAENGQDALEKLENLELDLIITDIKMPFMNGLEMAEIIKNKYPLIKIIIFSGFDDFQYAKEAISLNILEYILKPVNVEELNQILTKVKKILDEEIEEKRNIDRLRENFLNSLPVLKEKYLSDLLRNKLELEDLTDENLKNYEINLMENKNYVVTSLFVDSPTEDSKFFNEKNLIPITIKEFFNSYLESNYNFEIFNYSSYIVIICGINNQQEFSNYINKIDNICKECKKILNLKVTAGIGEKYAGLINMPTSYKESKNALGYKNIINGLGSSIYIKDVEPEKKEQLPLKLSSKLEGEFLVVIKFGSKEQIASLIEKIVLNITKDKMPLKNYQVYLIGILNSIVHLIQQYDLSIDYILNGEINYFEIISNFHTTEDLKLWLLDVCLKINDGITNSVDNTTKSVISKAKDYILENFKNPDLSVENLSSYLHISPAYFSSVFKKETGESYVTFLTNIRLSYAKELLQNTDEKTYIIAQNSGYLETSYFSYVFKKKYGISPTKFRGK